MVDETAQKPDLHVRDGDQPLPIPNDEVCTQQRFMNRVSQMAPARMELGLRRYGTLLQPFNGRDFMQDVFEEMFDAWAYLEGVAAERDAMLELLREIDTVNVYDPLDLGQLRTRVHALLRSMTPRPKPPKPPTYTVEIEHVTFTGLTGDQLFALDIDPDDAEVEA